jgi:NAD(P)-dependent dehydrogenase (short-subunit alcohol dehydrogenase family)
LALRLREKSLPQAKENARMTAPKTIVITGASDGIGAAAAQILHAQGEKVVLIGRSPEKTEGVAKPLGADWFTADFQDLHQVRTLAKTLKASYPRIDVLANNAGGLFAGPERTGDGFEKTFQVNHLAPFLLTHELLDVLLDSRASIVNTSSVAARLFGRVNIDDLNTWNGFTPTKAYGNSKLANILFTRGLHQHYSAQGLSAVAFHPGNVATNFAADTTSYLRRSRRRQPRLLLHRHARHRLGIRPLLQRPPPAQPHQPPGGGRQPRPPPLGSKRANARPPLSLGALRDPHGVAGRVPERAVAWSPLLFHRLLQDFGPGSHQLLEGGVQIVGPEHDDRQDALDQQFLEDVAVGL